MDKDLLNEILSNFEITDNLKTFKQISSGYINDTFKIYIDGNPRYILQKINSKVFTKPKDIFPDRQGFITGHRIPLELFSKETIKRLKAVR